MSLFCEESWWRHQMETFSAFLALFAGISPVTGEFPSQRPVTRSFDVFICAWINGWVNNREAGDLGRHRAHCDVIVMVDLQALTMLTYVTNMIWYSRDDCPFVTLRSTDMTVGKSVPAFPVEHFCKLVRLMDTGRNQNLLCVPESESCPLKIRAYFNTIR